MKKNSEILDILRRNRKISAFSRFLGITPQGVYGLLKNDKKQNSQYFNYILFIMEEFENGSNNHRH